MIDLHDARNMAEQAGKSVATWAYLDALDEIERLRAALANILWLTEDERAEPAWDEIESICERMLPARSPERNGE